MSPALLTLLLLTAPDDRRWGVGVELATIASPRGHLGPNGALTPSLVGRYELLPFAAVAAGVGLPHPSMGAGGWIAWELFAPLGWNANHTVVVSLFQQSGLQLGFAGPDYAARHGGSFVGYDYAAAGPLAFALRFPVGVNLRWAGGRIDTYVAAVPIAALTPDVEMLYDVTLGIRVRF